MYGTIRPQSWACIASLEEEQSWQRKASHLDRISCPSCLLVFSSILIQKGSRKGSAASLRDRLTEADGTAERACYYLCMASGDCDVTTGPTAFAFRLRRKWAIRAMRMIESHSTNSVPTSDLTRVALPHRYCVATAQKDLGKQDRGRSFESGKTG